MVNVDNLIDRRNIRELRNSGRHRYRNIRNKISEHISNNKKEYFLVTVIFIIGIFLGVMYTNKTQENQITEITGYFNNFIENFKNQDNINQLELLKTSLINNILFAVLLWFFGTTVIGIPVVFGMILYRGFSLGYTISTVIIIMGLQKGLAFVLLALLLQNILFIPAIIAIAVSGFKLYKSIIKNKERENIKVEVLRHTVFSLLMAIVISISSVIEILISTNTLKIFIKYF